MSRSTTLPEPWLSMAERAGGVAALASELGIAVSTLRSWGAGTRVPGAIVKNVVNAWARRRGLAAPFSVLRAPWKKTEDTMIEDKITSRWEFSIHGNERGSATKLLVVNSIDEDPKLVKVTINREQVIVPICDLVELLDRIEAQSGYKRPGSD